MAGVRLVLHRPPAEVRVALDCGGVVGVDAAVPEGIVGFAEMANGAFIALQLAVVAGALGWQSVDVEKQPEAVFGIAALSVAVPIAVENQAVGSFHLGGAGQSFV